MIVINDFEAVAFVIITLTTVHVIGIDADKPLQHAMFGQGRCQSGFCSPRTMEILEREVPENVLDISKSGGRSTIVVGRNKEI